MSKQCITGITNGPLAADVKWFINILTKETPYIELEVIDETNYYSVCGDEKMWDMVDEKISSYQTYINLINSRKQKMFPSYKRD